MPSINEFRPNPAGTDPALTEIELKGPAGTPFAGVLLSIESDVGSGAGTVDRLFNVSGTFDANGLLTVTVDDLENPSFTLVLLDSFAGSIGDDFDLDNDGTPDNLGGVGTVLDAIGITDAASGEPLYGAALGGTDLAFIGREPERIFRDGVTDALYSIDFEGAGNVFDANGNQVVATDFDQDPLAATFGAVNPTVDDGAGGGTGDAVFTLELLHAGDQEAATGAIGDAPRFSAVLNALRAEDLGNDGIADNTLTLSSGDPFIPGVFFDASETIYGTEGVADIIIQNELGFQAIALGNHEFDAGTGLLASLITGAGIDGFDGAAFPYLSTNLDFTGDANLAPLEVADGAAPQAGSVTGSVVIDVNGEPIGVIGATTPTLAAISSPGGVLASPQPFGSPPSAAELDALAAEIQVGVDVLLAENPGLNKVVLLAHMQNIAIEQALAERLTDVDIIVAGGSNTRLVDENDRLRDGDTAQGDYPIFVINPDGDSVAVVNTDGSYKYVGRLVLDFDADGKVIADSYNPNVSGAFATDAQGVADLGAESLIDPEIQAVVDAVEQQIIAAESNVLGFSDVFLNGNRSGDSTDGVRTQETNLGNLTADANLDYAQDSDPTVVLSLKNGGGIRASIGETVVLPGDTEATRLPNPELVDGDGNVFKPAGGISQNDIQTTLAFNNGLTLLTLTGPEIVALLEHGVSALPGVAGQFPQISGAEFDYDPDLPAGARIVEARLVDGNGATIATLVENGSLATTDADTFRIVTLDFLAAPRFDDSGNFIGGGDGYPFPNTNSDSSAGEVADAADLARINPVALEMDGVQTGGATFADDGTEQDALAEYLLENFGEATPFAEADVPADQDGRIEVVDTTPDFTSIYELQGDGLVSAFDGQVVTTRGIVTALDSNAFYIQDADGDGDIATSDAIFVFTGGNPGVSIGDEIEITATLTERVPGGTDTGNQPTTQLSGFDTLTVLTSGNALPDAVVIGQSGRVLPTESIDDDPLTFDPINDALDFFESLEGMRVTLEDAVAVAGTNQFGEIFAVANQGLGATGLSDRGTLNISEDDFNPEKVQIDADFGISGFSNPLVDTGDMLGDVTGVLSYAFGNYELVPTEDFTAQIIDADLEAETTDISGSEDVLTIASYNVLNLDPVVEEQALTNNGEARNVDDDLGDGRFDAVAQHIVNNLGTPDILALQEIQDNTGGETGDGVVAADETLQALIDAIDIANDGIDNDNSGYAFIDNPFISDLASGGQPGGNIRTAYLYQTDRVDLVEGSVATISGQGVGEAFEGARLPLVAKFEFNGEVVTVVNNHFSSKGGSQPIFGTTQPFEELQNDLNPDGSPVANGSLDERLAQAQAVADFVSGELAADPDARIVVAGDLNEFEFVSPVTLLEDAGLTNLTNTLDPDEAYTFNFQGNSQSLDHILVSDALLGGVQFDQVHVNSEFARTEGTASDHDPVIAGLVIEETVETAKTETVSINLLSKSKFGRTKAEISVTDANGDVESETIKLKRFSREIEFDEAGVTLKSSGPGFDFVTAIGGGLGVSSRADFFSFKDRLDVDRKESLKVKLEGDDEANRLLLEFADHEGDVELVFFNDGERMSREIYAYEYGTLEIALDEDTFDKVKISGAGHEDVRVTGIEFDRVMDDLAAPDTDVFEFA